jgi:transcriptional regulator with XRE-family HTH domain
MDNDFRIAEILKGKGITQTELAEKMGISRVGLSKAINGNTTITTLRKIAAALEVDVVDLFEQSATDVINCPYCGGKIKVGKE